MDQSTVIVNVGIFLSFLPDGEVFMVAPLACPAPVPGGGDFLRA